MTKLNDHLHKFWASERAILGLRVFLCFGLVTLICWSRNRLQSLPALYFGVIAATLIEVDDDWLGRLQAVLLSLVCFFVNAVITVTLAAHPIGLLCHLVFSTFALTLLGAISERYASIAIATVAVEIFTMFLIDQHSNLDPSAIWQPLNYMLGGTIFYGVVSVIWARLFATRPVRNKLAQVFVEIGHLLELQAALLEPDPQQDRHPLRLAVSTQNAQVVAALDRAQWAIIARFGRSGRDGMQSGEYLRLLYMAQEFHERAFSMHYPQRIMSQTAFHSNFLFRAQRLVVQQGKACRTLAEAIRLRRSFHYSQMTTHAFQHVQASLDHFQTHLDRHGDHQSVLGAFDLLFHNLQSIEQRLEKTSQAVCDEDARAHQPQLHAQHSSHSFFWQILQHLTPMSVIFRHGLRLAIALGCGFIAIHVFHPASGNWVLLTLLFVCRPSYGATQLRLMERIVGTFIGLVISWVCMKLSMDTVFQLCLALVGALLFTILRVDRYISATTAVTVMVLMCLNQIGNGFVLIWPRMFDTLIGCAIAAAASYLILPDWQGRRLHLVCANVIGYSASFLTVILQQNTPPPTGERQYDLARRDLYHSAAALTTALSNVLSEPGRFRGNLDAGFRFLSLCNTMLGYLSALGAYRTHLSPPTQTILQQVGPAIEQTLQALAQTIQSQQHCEELTTPQETTLIAQLEQPRDETDLQLRTVLNQLISILRIQPALRHAANALASLSQDAPHTQ